MNKGFFFSFLYSLILRIVHFIYFPLLHANPFFIFQFYEQKKRGGGTFSLFIFNLPFIFSFCKPHSNTFARTIVVYIGYYINNFLVRRRILYHKLQESKLAGQTNYIPVITIID